MLHDQALYPPNYYVNIFGHHKETTRNGNKETKTQVLDFHIRINLTHLLYPQDGTKPGATELLPANKRGYRGGRIISLSPSVGDAEVEASGDALRAWCDKYVADGGSVKTFQLTREITNHDTAKLEQLLRSAAASANYRGHTSVKMSIEQDRVVVYSPGRINSWRTTQWIRYVFYWTFMWIFAWPVLLLMTHRYQVVKVVFPYADTPGGGDMQRKPTVMSEGAWFNLWESAIQRGMVARMNCESACMDDDYRLATAEADARGALQAREPQRAPSTGNAFADGAFGLLSAGLRVAGDYRESRGWGGDC